MFKVHPKNAPQFWALFVLVSGLALTGYFWRQAEVIAAEQLQAELQHQTKDIANRLAYQLKKYELLIRGFEGLFSASDKVTRSAFHQYFQTLYASGHDAGFAGIAYHEVVLAKDLKSHIASLKNEGFSDYHVFPEGGREVYGPGRFIEPFSGKNLKVIGFDPLAIPVERMAIERARDTDDVSISAKLTLAQDSNTKVPGFVMYVPVFRRGSVRTEAGRRANFTGWIDAPFRMNDLIASVLPEGLHTIDLEIFDGTEQSEANLLFDADPLPRSMHQTSPRVTQQLGYGGRNWTLVVYAMPSFGLPAIKQRPNYIATSGILLSVLLSLVLLLVLRAQYRRKLKHEGLAAELERLEREALNKTHQQSLEASVWAMNEAQRIGKVGTYVTDIKTGIWQCSAMADEIFGIDSSFEKDIPHWNALIAPEFQKELLDHYYQVITSNGKFNREYQVIRPVDGQRCWVEALGEFSFDDAGKPEFLRGTIHDIHKRKMAQLALQEYQDDLEQLVQQKTREIAQQKDQLLESETRFTLAVEGADAGIWDLNLVTQALYHSPRMAHMLGYTTEELPTVREIWDKLGCPDDVLLYRKKLIAHIKDADVPFETIIRLRHKNGQWCWILSRGRASRDASGRAVRVTGTHIDITERKQIEEDLRQAKEAAEVANTTKDAFLANMSHELRTPLSAVIGIANLAQGISTEPRLRDYLEKIVRSGKHLNRIINELLDLSKIAAGRMELEIISFSLRTVIAHVESVMAHRATEKGLAIVMVIDDAVPDVLLGDPTRVAQIFLNLIGNALKFTEAGWVTVSVGLQASKGGRVCLDIDFEDTGIGMRPEALKQLFKPFSQADATVSRKFGGTGLGLTISRGLANMMDGDISVTSIEGCGSTFKLSIWLGLGDAADLLTAEPVADDALPKRYQDARILVADDQPLNREIVEALLTAVGITPHLAENGQQALDILTEPGSDPFDLVLMDIQMPIMDGLTATRAMRGRAGFESLPIIAMTAHTMAHEQELNQAAGMNDHIGKPFDNVSFYRTLAKWIPKKKQKATCSTEALPAKPEALPETGNELSSLRGVDVSTALERFCGNEVSYRRWLTEFVSTARTVPGQIRSEIEAGEMDKAGKLVHAFKGRVGMLGMTALHSSASALELVLHDGTPADEMLAMLERSIDEMCNELERVLNSGTADTTHAKQVLKRVVWNDSYSVGVPALDDQHKKLFGMINRLADCHADRSSGSSGAVQEVLSSMFDHTQVHFADEEDYMQRIGYPQLADQKIEHAAFVEEMAAFNMAASEGFQDEAAVHHYLKTWFLSHILESDMQFRHFVEGTPIARQ